MREEKARAADGRAAADDARAGTAAGARGRRRWRTKGRIKVGADADLTIFDPATVIDRATYEDASIPSAGIPYVIVGGQVVVDGGQVAARPGRAIRAPH